ncbi:hypothetical protein [Pseudonocardia acidicola]|uniref:CDP-Glycerol:Poly(Glycerophosphate) glycerophosphotransferase n=1 Tax=Pseudonocardia acidicola TaxID=2724939 RepID=A0ABX1S9W9_9PSEU|nr:hypothetical protein [Pseudonocardia acidicola]NMH98364.1 hypothetical protein [Pseudonocardia acidicola]
MGERKRTDFVRDRMCRARALLRRARELPHRLEALDRHLAAIDAELRAVRDDVTAVQSRLDRVLATAGGSQQALAELRDSVHLAARRTALQRRPARVLFLVHVLGAWDSCHALVAAMAGSDDFEPIVASIPRRFRGSDGLYGEEDVHRGLVERGVPHLRFADGDARGVLQLIKAIEPDVIFRQSQWDADVPDELGTEALGFARTCLIPYETMNIVVNVPDARTLNTAVDSDYHRCAWLVFCTNEMMLETAVRDGARGGAQFRVVGHPKADHLLAATPDWPLGSAADDAARPGRVVWSAHHTIGRGWTDFGAFHLMRDGMLAWARQRTDVQFVFMPHPALLPFPDSDACSIRRPDFDAWMQDWAELPNTAVLSEADYGPTLAASDMMLTDGLSMLVEYQLFGKPVIFFERDGHRPFNAIGEQVVTGVHTVHTVDEACRLAEKFLGGNPDPLRPRQRNNVRRLFGAGGSTERILAALRHEMACERGE